MLQVFSDVGWEWLSNNKVCWFQRQGIIYLLFLFLLCLSFSKVVYSGKLQKNTAILVVSAVPIVYSTKISHVLYIIKKKDFSVICRIAPVTTT